MCYQVDSVLISPVRVCLELKSDPGTERTHWRERILLICLHSPGGGANIVQGGLSNKIGQCSKFSVIHSMRTRQKIFYQIWKSRAHMAFSHTQAAQGLILLSDYDLFFELGSEFNYGILFR